MSNLVYFKHLLVIENCRKNKYQKKPRSDNNQMTHNLWLEKKIARSVLQPYYFPRETSKYHPIFSSTVSAPDWVLLSNWGWWRRTWLVRFVVPHGHFTSTPHFKHTSTISITFFDTLCYFTLKYSHTSAFSSENFIRSNSSSYFVAILFHFCYFRYRYI